MTTTTEVCAGEPIARRRASGVAENLRHHRTLYQGILYVITIIAVLAVVGRL